MKRSPSPPDDSSGSSSPRLPQRGGHCSQHLQWEAPVPHETSAFLPTSPQPQHGSAWDLVGKKQQTSFTLHSLFFREYSFSCLFLRSGYLNARSSSSMTAQNIHRSFTIYKLSQCWHFRALPGFCFQRHFRLGLEASRISPRCPNNAAKCFKASKLHAKKWGISGRVALSVWEIMASRDTAKGRQGEGLDFLGLQRSHLQVVYRGAGIKMVADLRMARGRACQSRGDG